MAQDSFSYDDASKPVARGFSYEDASSEPPRRTALDVAKDVGITALKGAVGLPQSVVGVADLVTGGRAGKAVEDAGVRFKDTQEFLADQYSDAQKAANRKVAEADGFVGTAQAMLENPSTIATSVGESIPQMLGGAGVARGVLAAGAKVAPAIAGAIGEGVLGAGSQAEQVRQETADGLLTPKQAALTAASGLTTGAFGVLGGRVSQRLGIGDADTMLAQGSIRGAGPASQRSLARQVGEGLLSEGVLEEVPQSMAEQALQNLALDKPVGEGVGASAAQGLLAGGAMGGGAALVHGVGARGEPAAATPAPAPAPAPDPLQLGYQPDTLVAFPDGTVGRQAEVDAYLARLPENQRAAERARLMGLSPQASPPTTEAPAGAPAARAAPLPSQAMGIDPAAGPLSTGAAIAVDSGAHGQLLQDAQRQADAAALVEQEQATAANRAAPPVLDYSDLAERDRALYDDYFRTLDRETEGHIAAALADDVPDFGGRNVTDEQFLRALGANDQEIADAIQAARGAAGPEERAGGAVAPAADVAEGARPAAAAAPVQQGQAEPAQAVAAPVTPATTAPASEAPTSVQDGIARARGRRVTAPAPAAPAAAPAPAGAPVPSFEGSAVPKARREKALQRVEDGKAWFLSQGKADAFVSANGLSDTHEVVPENRRFVVKQTAAASTAPAAPTAPTARPEPREPLPAAKQSGRLADGEWATFAADSGTKGVPRAQMPQIRAEHRGAMVNFMNARGIAHAEETVPADSLKPTQAEFSPERVQRAGEFSGGDRATLVSSDGHVLDGHHQWLAARNKGEDVRAIRLDAPIDDLLTAAREFPSSTTDGSSESAGAGSAQPEEGKPARGVVAKIQRAEAVSKTQSGPASAPVASSAADSVPFKKWFGESKVVDAEGRPRVMYHGTSASEGGEAFTTFDTYASNYGLMGMGGYFTEDPAVASSYTSKGKGGTPSVYPVYLSIKNPIDMDAKADERAWKKQFPGAEQYHEGGDSNESWYRAAEEAMVDERVPKWEGAEAMQDGLRAMGFDGITHVGGGRVKSDGVRHRVFIAFEPDQVKSAIGNRGTFDPTNPDIRFRRDGTEGMPSSVANAMRALSRPTYSPQARTQAVATVRKTVDAIRSAWGNAPDIVVAFDMNDAAVPEAARRADLRQRSGGARGAPEGFYYRGKAYLMASRLGTPEDAARVLYHEVLGHHGLRGTFGKQLDGVLNQIATMRRAEVDAKVREYGLRGVNKLDRRAAAEEVLAEMAQSTPELHFVRRAVAAIRTWLRENVPGFRGLRLTDDEIIRNFILPARAFVERSAGAAAPRAGFAFSRAEGIDPDAESRAFLDGAPVAQLSGKEFAPDGVPISDKVTQHYATTGNAQVEVPGIGLVSLDRQAVKSSLYHGIGRDKATAFAAVPDVLKNGKIIHAEAMEGARDAGMVYHVAAPVRIGDRDMVEVVLVKADSNAKRMYVHEVVLKEKLRQPAVEAGAGAAGAGVQTRADAGAIRSVLDRIYSVNPARGEPTSTDQTSTAAFRAWFGDSKVVDAQGAPLEVFHGTTAQFTAFSDEFLGEGDGNADWGNGFYFTDQKPAAEGYAQGEGGRVLDVYLSLKNPAPLEVVNQVMEQPGAEMDDDYVRQELISRGYDGIIVTHKDGGREFVVFQPGQIKSASGNAGTFDDSNPDIMFSRSTVGEYARTAAAELNNTFSAPGRLSWWHKTIGTMYNLAERSPAFKPVFDAAQGFVDDVSHYATDAAELAPKLLPKLETWRDIKKSPISAADNTAVAKPVFEGTLTWARDEQGAPVQVQTLIDAAAGLTSEQKAQRLLRNGMLDERMLKAWQGMPLESYEKAVASRYESRMLQPGVVWSDAELRSMFQLTDDQVALYREFREATNRSLDTMARADMLRFAGDDAKGLRTMVMDAPDAQAAAVLIRDHLAQLAGDQPDRATLLMNTANGIMDRADKVRDLQARGYAPLSRFGRYSVDVVDAKGERQYFGLFETAREANTMAARMRGEFGETAVSQGTLSEEAFKMFAGVTPETLELFGNALGLDSTGDRAQDQAFQEYLKLTKTNRSAMRRLIHRKGIAGFSEDVCRVLASFIYSNARQTAAGLNMGDLGEAVNAIPKEQGELKDVAVRLAEYVKNPQEEAQAVRGLLFAQYLGGSIASAFVNMTQPAAVTFPWLSQFGGARKAAAALGAAAKNMATKGFEFEPDLAKALKTAEDEGVVAPQEVHQLMAQARGSGSLRAGDGTRLGDARASGQNALSRLSLAWGKVFGAAEQVNRRMTFIAAYRVARDRGEADPAAFASRAVRETQFVYSKASKMQWGRGAVGGTMMCVDDTTEALTSEGWKTVDELREGALIASFDMSSEKLLWKPVQMVFQKEKAGEMIHVKDRNLDMFMTPDHRVVTYREERVPGQRSKYHRRLQIQEAQNLTSKDCIPVAAPFDHQPAGEALPDALVRVIGWAVTEGHFVKKNRGREEWGGHLRIGQNEGPKAERIRQDLTAAGLPWVEHRWHYKNGNAQHICFTIKKSACAALRDLLPEKALTPALLMRMTTAQIRELVDVMVAADGHTDSRGKRCFIQNPGHTLDSFQMALTMLGVSFSVHQHGPAARKVVLKDAKWYTLSRTKGERVPFEGRVWCPIVADTYTWVARRGGRVFITHNTFKTYSIAYLELLHRMYTQGGPEGKRAALLALGMLMLMGGSGGLPFAEDAEDVADALAQLLGYNFSAKKARQEVLEAMLPKGIADFLDKGVSGLPGAPLDVSGRLGMGNLIPGTGLLQQKTSHTRDVLEIAGPAGDFASRIFSGALNVAKGNVGAGALEVAPTAVRNAAKGVDMAATGMYRDAKGYKVLETNHLEAALKAIGFQPQSVATIQEANALNQQAKGFYNLRAQEIRAQWAAGIFEKDDAKVRAAREAIADWNAKNPDQPMVIRITDLNRRVREMAKSKDQRIADTAPRAMRAQMREDAARARATAE